MVRVRKTFPERGTNMKVLAMLVAVLFGSLAGADMVEWSVSDGGNGHWYEVVVIEPGISWDNANAAATACGGYLASITSASENSFIYEIAAESPGLWRQVPDNSIGPWLGGYQTFGAPEPGGGWAWTTSEPFSYTNWGTYEPNNSSGIEDRLQFFGWRDDTGDYWNDYPNSETFWGTAVGGYVVEYDQHQVPEPASMALVLAGLGAIDVYKRRKERHRSS